MLIKMFPKRSTIALLHLRKKYRYADIVPINNNDRQNAWRVTRPNGDILIIKHNFHDYIIADHEVAILQSLPAWWGLRFADSFKIGDLHYVATHEIANIPWSQYNEEHADTIATFLYRQIEWLYNNNILHTDLRLDNILLNVDQTTAIIIDFEKHRTNISREQLYAEYMQFTHIFPSLTRDILRELIVANLDGYENQKSTKLDPTL